MRPTLGRLTLRGARAVAGGTTRATYAVSARPLPAPRDLCTSSALSAEAKRKSDGSDPDPKDPDRLAVLADDPPEPAVHVLTTDTDMSAVETPLPANGAATTAEPLGETAEGQGEIGVSSTADEAGNGIAQHGPIKTPKELHAHMQDLLGKNAMRSALFHYAAAFKVEGVPSIDAEVMKLMLPVLGRNSWSSTAKDTLDLALDKGYRLGIGSINCGLHAMARSGMSAEITGILDRIWAMPGDSNPNATSYNYLIGSHIYRGNVDEAFDVLNDMKKHLIYPTFATYHALITGCLRRRDPRRAYQTLIAVEKQRFDISAMTVAQVMVSSANNDDFDNVNHLLAKFEECLPRYGNELHRIAEFRGLYRLKDSQRTNKSDRDSLRGDPKPEIGAISAVLHCAFRGGRVDIASRAWTLMEDYYPEFDIPLPLWYCLVGAYSGAGDFTQAIDIVGTMREKGLKPSMRDMDMSLIRPLAYDVNVIDEQFYRLCDRNEGKEDLKGVVAPSDVMSQTMSDQDDTAKDISSSVSSSIADQDPAAKDLSEPTEISTDEAEVAESDGQKDVAADTTSSGATHEEMSADTSGSGDGPEEMNADTKPANSLADALFSGDSSLAGVSIGQRFRPKTVGIDELNCIIGACSAAHDLDRAFQTFDEVETRFKLERNIDTYNALLEGCVQTRRLAGGIRVLEEIESVGLPVSGYTLHLAARLMLRAARTADVTKLLKKAKSQRDAILLQTYQMVLRHFVRGEDFEAAIELWKQGEEDGFEFKALTGRFDLNSVRRLQAAANGEVDSEYERGQSELDDDTIEDDGMLSEGPAGEAEEYKP